MTTGPRSQCDACVRFRSPFSAENTHGLSDAFCAAFPDGIPDRVYYNGVDHRQPVEGDHGVRFEAKPGDRFPEHAFA